MNKWGIPDYLEKVIRNRDKNCIYCGIKMFHKIAPGRSRKCLATWEHIINNANIINRNNIALCCSSCNSSKGTKKLSDWLESDYCKRNKINKNTVSKIVKSVLRKGA